MTSSRGVSVREACVGERSRTGRREFLAAAAAGGTFGVVRAWSPAPAPAAAARASRGADGVCIARRPGRRTTALALDPRSRVLWRADVPAAALAGHGLADLAPTGTIALGGVPVALAVLGDGRRAVVACQGPSKAGVVVVDLRRGTVVARLDPGPAPRAVAAEPDGRHAVVAGGAGEGWVARIDVRTGRVVRRAAVGRHPRGVAVGPDGRRILVTLNGDGAVARVSFGRRTAVRLVPCGPFPADVALSPDGRLGVVTHDGFGSRTVTPLDVAEGRAGRAWTAALDPAGVQLAARGAAVVVAERGSGTVAVLDARTGRRRRRVRTGGRPASLVVLGGRRAVVADEETGALTEVRL